MKLPKLARPCPLMNKTNIIVMSMRSANFHAGEWTVDRHVDQDINEHQEKNKGDRLPVMLKYHTSRYKSNLEIVFPLQDGFVGRVRERPSREQQSGWDLMDGRRDGSWTRLSYMRTLRAPPGINHKNIEVGMWVGVCMHVCSEANLLRIRRILWIWGQIWSPTRFTQIQ